MIQFARALGLEVSLASYSMLGDLLLKARGGSGAYPVTSRYPTGTSPFPSVVGSSTGDSVASRPVYPLPTFNEIEGTNVVVSGNVLEKPCSSKQADARLTMGTEVVKNLGLTVLELCSRLSQVRRRSRVHASGQCKVS